MVAMFLLVFIAILLTLIAATDLVLTAHTDWASRRRMAAGAALILLFVSEITDLSVFSITNFNAGSIVLILAGHTLGLILTQYTTGLFRWSATIAGIVLILWWKPTLGILTSSQGLQ